MSVCPWCNVTQCPPPGAPHVSTTNPTQAASMEHLAIKKFKFYNVYFQKFLKIIPTEVFLNDHVLGRSSTFRSNHLPQSGQICSTIFETDFYFLFKIFTLQCWSRNSCTHRPQLRQPAFYNGCSQNLAFSLKTIIKTFYEPFRIRYSSVGVVEGVTCFCGKIGP